MIMIIFQNNSNPYCYKLSCCKKDWKLSKYLNKQEVYFHCPCVRLFHCTTCFVFHEHRHEQAILSSYSTIAIY